MIQQQRAHTKIVATVGPACRSEPQLGELIDAGVDVFRLNMAHATLDQHTATVDMIRRAAASRGMIIGILADLAGPKIRLGDLLGDEQDLITGSEVRFVRGESATEPDELVCNYAALIDELAVGDCVMLVDGTIRLKVLSVDQQQACCRVEQGGPARSRQGVNLPGVKIKLPALSEEDREHVTWAAQVGIDFVGLSFVRHADEVRELQMLLAAQHSNAHVIAKIEKQEAVDQLEEIVMAADGVMVARGDLGVEIDVAGMPVLQKRIVDACHRHNRPVIIATQMLDSMQRSPQPTRAEVTDVANAILDGCDATMLSGETAVGMFPRQAVEMMNRIAIKTEPLLLHRDPPEESVRETAGIKPVTEAVVYGAVRIARRLPAQMIVVVSRSGGTARALSRRRSSVTIIGASDRPETLRQMSLLWGVVPLSDAPTDDSQQLLEFVEPWGLREGMLTLGGYIVLVAGQGLASTGHNMIRVHQIKKKS